MVTVAAPCVLHISVVDSISGPINRPPLAHTGPPGSHGPSLFPSHPAHSQPSTPAPPRTHPDGLSGNPMGAGSGGMPGTPTPTSVSNATSPLVVPQPMKARTIKTYHCRMCDQVSNVFLPFVMPLTSTYAVGRVCAFVCIRWHMFAFGSVTYVSQFGLPLIQM